MADIRIAVTCLTSGLSNEFEYDGENTFSDFNADLQSAGMGFKVDPAKGKAEEEFAGMIVEEILYRFGRIGFNENDNDKKTLAELGVVDQSRIFVASCVNVDGGEPVKRLGKPRPKRLGK